MSATPDPVDAAGAPGRVEAADGSTLVDARGLRCPIPVIRLARVASTLAPGDLVTVWSTDPAAVHDVPAWARMRGHTVVRSTVVDHGAGDVAATGDESRSSTAGDTGTTLEVTTAITVRLDG